MRECARLRDTVRAEFDGREVILGMDTAARIWIEDTKALPGQPTPDEGPLAARGGLATRRVTLVLRM